MSVREEFKSLSPAPQLPHEVDARDREYQRTYHDAENSPYPLPRPDEFADEGLRLNVQHELIKYLYQGNFRGPSAVDFKRGMKVLDVGCGTAIWIAQLTVDFPESTFVGVDLVLPELSTVFNGGVPHNVQVVLGNVLERLPFEDNTFDYVHEQFLNFGIPEKQWPHVISELRRVTKPGGWIDCSEFDGAPFSNYGPTAAKFTAGQVAVMATRGVNMNIGRHIESFVVGDGGIVDIKSERVCAALGWDGKFGELWGEDVRRACLGLRDGAAKAMKLTPEQYDMVLETVVREWADHKSFNNLHRSYGRKR